MQIKKKKINEHLRCTTHRYLSKPVPNFYHKLSPFWEVHNHISAMMRQQQNLAPVLFKSILWHTIHWTSRILSSISLLRRVLSLIINQHLVNHGVWEHIQKFPSLLLGYLQPHLFPLEVVLAAAEMLHSNQQDVGCRNARTSPKNQKITGKNVPLYRPNLQSLHF